MNFKIAVKGIIRRGDGKILIVKRNESDSFMPGIWETVGGGIDKKDSPQNALVREIMEEVGLAVSIREPFNVFTFQNDRQEFKIGITFVCEYLSGEARLSPEHSKYAWIDPKDIKDYDSIPALYNEIVEYANKFSESYEKFNVSQKAVIIRDSKCFIAEVDKRPGIWDLPGGRIDKREDGRVSFRREIQEEIGVSDFEDLGVFDCETWPTKYGAPVCGSASLVHTEQDIVLSKEHTKGKWISENEIDQHEFIWPGMAKMIRKGFWYDDIMRKKKIKF